MEDHPGGGEVFSIWTPGGDEASPVERFPRGADGELGDGEKRAWPFGFRVALSHRARIDFTLRPAGR